MAFVQNYNPLDDQSETQGATTGQTTSSPGTASFNTLTDYLGGNTTNTQTGTTNVAANTNIFNTTDTGGTGGSTTVEQAPTEAAPTDGFTNNNPSDGATWNQDENVVVTPTTFAQPVQDNQQFTIDMPGYSMWNGGNDFTTPVTPGYSIWNNNPTLTPVTPGYSTGIDQQLTPVTPGYSTGNFTTPGFLGDITFQHGNNVPSNFTTPGFLSDKTLQHGRFVNGIPVDAFPGNNFTIPVEGHAIRFLPTGTTDTLGFEQNPVPNETQKAANVTQGTGFTNIQRYLNANRPGGTYLGQQVAGTLGGKYQTALNKIGDVNALAASAPAGNIYNTKEDLAAQQAINDANKYAALTGNAYGQTQLIKNLNPNVSTGGLNLDQFLLQQSPEGYGAIKTQAQNIAPLQQQYATKAEELQTAATTLQALKKLEEQAAAGKAGAGTSTTSGSWTGGNGVTIPTTGGVIRDTSLTNPYQGLTQDQINYLNSLRGGTTTGGATVNPNTGTITRTDITRTATPTRSGEGGGGVNIGIGGTGGTGVGGLDANGTMSTGLGGLSIDAQGNVSANTTGLSNTAANVLGSIVGAIAGIPGLGLIASQINNAINTNAANAVTGFNNDMAAAVAGANAGALTDAQQAANEAAAIDAMSNDTTSTDSTDSADSTGSTDTGGYGGGFSDADAIGSMGGDTSGMDGGDTSSGDSGSDSSGGDSSGGDSGGGDSGGGDGGGGDGGGGDGGGGDGGGGGWAHGGIVTQNRLHGPNPKGPDTGYGALQSGEYVIPAHIVKELGKDFFDKLIATRKNKGQ